MAPFKKRVAGPGRPGLTLSGQSLIEFALLMPLLLILMFTVVDATEAARATLTARSAATQAARYMEQENSASASAAAAAGKAAAQGGMRASSALEVTYSSPVTAKSRAYRARVKQADGSWRTASVRDQTVTVTFTARQTYRTFLGQAMGSPTITVSASAKAVKTVSVVM